MPKSRGRATLDLPIFEQFLRSHVWYVSLVTHTKHDPLKIVPNIIVRSITSLS